MHGTDVVWIEMPAGVILSRFIRRQTCTCTTRIQPVTVDADPGTETQEKDASRYEIQT
jgi:hypothetical protein